MENLLSVTSRAAFRAWLQTHAAEETECWVRVRRGRPADEDRLWYLDAVEEALCFGWIDSTSRADALAHLIAMTRQGRLYGEWNDYGRLL